MALTLGAAAALAACAQPESSGSDGTGTHGPPAMSPSDLPTLATPSGPPTAPTDPSPTGVVAGRVSALADGCTEVTTDDGVAWSLAGERTVEVVVGDVVTAKVEPPGEGEAACGQGTAARLVSLTVVG